MMILFMTKDKKTKNFHIIFPIATVIYIFQVIVKFQCNTMIYLNGVLYFKKEILLLGE